VDSEELHRIIVYVKHGIAMARAMVNPEQDVVEFVETVRQVRKLHKCLIDAIAENEALVTEEVRGLAVVTGNLTDDLEATAALLARRTH
jgi:flagellar biosynthesis regulator FlaF